MVGLSFCDFVGTRMEKALMALLPGSPEAEGRVLPFRTWRGSCDASCNGLSKRNSDICCFRASLWWAEQHGTIKEHVSQSLKAICSIFSFSSLEITKEELATKLELDEFRKHVTSLAALDFLVCLKSDVFVMTHGGNFANLMIGHRRYMGHRLKSIKPDKGIMTKSLPLHGLGHIRGRRDHHPPDTNRSTRRNFP